MMRFIYNTILAIALLAGPSAHAGFIGKSVEFYTVTETENLFGPVVVGAELEYQPFLDFIDISDTSITVGNMAHFCEGNCPPIASPQVMAGKFFGFRLVDHLNLIAPIIGIEVASSNIAGFSAGDIEYSENEIFLRFQNLNGYTPGNVIPRGQAILNVAFFTAAEPGTLVLFCIGIAGIFSVRRRYNPVAPAPPGRLGCGTLSV